MYANVAVIQRVYSAEPDRQGLICLCSSRIQSSDKVYAQVPPNTGLKQGMNQWSSTGNIVHFSLDCSVKCCCCFAVMPYCDCFCTCAVSFLFMQDYQLVGYRFFVQRDKTWGVNCVRISTLGWINQVDLEKIMHNAIVGYLHVSWIFYDCCILWWLYYILQGNFRLFYSTWTP